MPIESEIKIVLKSSPELLEFLSRLESDVLEQFYTDGGRVRFDGKSHIFAFKKRLPNGDNLEIETPISPHDYELFLSVADSGLSKTRYYFKNAEIDIFGATSVKPGLIMCEIEGADKSVPDELIDFIDFYVAPDDKTYSSHALSVGYARNTNS